MVAILFGAYKISYLRLFILENVCPKMVNFWCKKFNRQWRNDSLSRFSYHNYFQRPNTLFRPPIKFSSRDSLRTPSRLSKPPVYYALNTTPLIYELRWWNENWCRPDDKMDPNLGGMLKTWKFRKYIFLQFFFQNRFHTFLFDK